MIFSEQLAEPLFETVDQIKGCVGGPRFGGLGQEAGGSCKKMRDPATNTSGWYRARPFEVWQEGGQQANHGEEGADVIDEIDAGVVGEFT
jgi:hypothetical protein